MGSIGGGGRYDNLTGSFGLPGVSGVGVSFGAERIYDVLETLDQFPEDIQMGAKIMLIAFDSESHLYAYHLTQQLRAANIAADLYPEPKKLQKQMKYANANHVPFVILIGHDEMESGLLSFKNMSTGEQLKLSIEDIINQFS
jgi:histidyl-tRNA synthetase